jgi:FkbM family methyltransferase
VWRWFARNSDSAIVTAFRHGVHMAARYAHAENHDIATNGETFLLDCLGDQATTILDVGAFRGDWTIEAANRCPSATVYSFEIASPTRRELAARVGEHPRIKVMPSGLADRAGSISIKFYPSKPEWTSTHDYPHAERAEWLEEQATTGDAALDEIGAARIDLLKLDTEGSELAILHGFAGALNRRAIRAIQFEYGYAAVLSRGLLIDYYELLEPLGYRIGRLSPRGIGLRPYRLEDENFFGPNMVAVHEDETQLIGRLGSA